MTQSTKLFVVLGFMFIIYTTLNGHLEGYLRVLFGGKPSSQSSNNIGSAAKAFAGKTLSDAIGKL